MRPRLVSDIEICSELLSIRLKISFREGSVHCWDLQDYSKIEPCALSAGFITKLIQIINFGVSQRSQKWSLSKKSLQKKLICWFANSATLLLHFFLLHIQIVKMQISNTTATLFVYIFALHCFYSLFTWTKDE